MKQILRNSGLTLRLAPFTMAFMLLFATTVAQPAHASILSSVKCAALSLFASATKTTLKISEAAMKTTFALEIDALQTTWKLEDIAIGSVRAVGESTFNLTLNAFQNRPGIFIHNTAYRTQAVETYRTSMLNALHTLETNTDAARAQYREDMMALVKAHQEALTNLVNQLISTITNAVNNARAHCSSNGVVATVIAVIAGANLKLLAQGAAQDVTDLAKALQIKLTRDGVFLHETSAFLGKSADATLKLAAAFLTRK